jgi:hypothetical protein
VTFSDSKACYSETLQCALTIESYTFTANLSDLFRSSICTKPSTKPYTQAIWKNFSYLDMMPDELDVRDDREEAHEEGGDDEVGLNAAFLGGLHHPADSCTEV